MTWFRCRQVEPIPGPLSTMSRNGSESRNCFPTVRSWVFPAEGSCLPRWRKGLDNRPMPQPGGRLILLERLSLRDYVPTGHLLYANDGYLYVVPFALNPPRALGEEVRIANDITTNAGSAELAVSRSGDIVYVPGQPTDKGELVWVSRQDNEVTPAWPGIRHYSSFKLSPDGTKVAIGVHDDNGSSVWIHDFISDALASHLYWTKHSPNLDTRWNACCVSMGTGRKGGIVLDRARCDARTRTTDR